MTRKNSDFDVMAIGAHPDDVEIFCGGTLLKLKSEGKRAMIVDLTDGSSGTRGNATLRSREAIKGAKVLGVEVRINLGLTDTAITNNKSSQLALIEVIRKYRPKVVITHWHEDEHPDHRHACELVRDACYLSGLAKIETSGECYRPPRILYFPGNGYHAPSFCVDISDYWKKKMKSIACYSSQFFGPQESKYNGKSDLATPEFLQSLELRSKYFGRLIKRAHAEAFICEETPEVADITQLGEKKF